MVHINLEELAYFRNSECCNPDFWLVHIGYIYALKFQGVAVNQS